MRYRGIALSSTITKVLEIIILHRMAPILGDACFPHPSPLFLVVMDLLLRKMSQKSIGLSIHDVYVGSGGHADDICTIAANKSSLMSHVLLVRDFTENTCLNLNGAKCDVVRMTGRSSLCGEKIALQVTLLKHRTKQSALESGCVVIFQQRHLSKKTSLKQEGLFSEWGRWELSRGP